MYMLHNTYLLCQSLAFSLSTSTKAQFHIKIQIERVHAFLVNYIDAQKQSGTVFFSQKFSDYVIIWQIQCYKQKKKQVLQ